MFHRGSMMRTSRRWCSSRAERSRVGRTDPSLRGCSGTRRRWPGAGESIARANHCARDLLDGSRKELVHTRADKDLLGRICRVAYQEPPGKSGGRGAGVRERGCKRSTLSHRGHPAASGQLQTSDREAVAHRSITWAALRVEAVTTMLRPSSASTSRVSARWRMSDAPSRGR
jgi:hypothetical protein